MTMTNAEWIIKNGYKFKNIDMRQSRLDFCVYEIYIGNVLIDTYRCTNEITYSEILVKWLDMERVEQILDEAEKRYLKGVIMPFRNEIKGIKKDNYRANKLERIYFFTKEGELFYLKSFKANTMYKGMEQKRQYTLEELGL